jgi:hypothetical protein
MDENNLMKVEDTQINDLKFFTYNVWFDDAFREERYQIIMQMIEESDADFVCL